MQRTLPLSSLSLDISHPSDPAMYPSLAQFLPMYCGSLECKGVLNTGLNKGLRWKNKSVGVCEV